MSGIGPVWSVGAVVGLFLAFCALVSDWMCDLPPRETVAVFARRSLAALVWPVAVPVYLFLAWRRDEW